MTLRSVQVYGSEICPLLKEDLRKPRVFDHQCLKRIAPIWGDHQVSNAEVHRKVIDWHGRTINELMSSHRQRWCGRYFLCHYNGLVCWTLSHSLALGASDQREINPWHGSGKWMLSEIGLVATLGSVSPVENPGTARIGGENAHRHGSFTYSMAFLYPCCRIQCAAMSDTAGSTLCHSHSLYLRI